NWGRAFLGSDNAWMEVAKQLGLQSNNILNEHSAAPTNLIHRMTTATKAKIYEPRNWWDGLMQTLDYAADKLGSAEAASRVAAMRARAEELGWKPGDIMDENTALELALAYKETMGDYGAKGELFRAIDQIFPLASTPITYGRSFGKSVFGGSIDPRKW